MQPQLIGLSGFTLRCVSREPEVEVQIVISWGFRV